MVENSGIKFDKGILVDNWMKTNIENIYAAGDVAQAPDLLTSENTISPTWSNAVYQGVTAGSNMAGEKVRYEGDLRMNIIDIFGLSVVSIGLRKKKECEVISRSSIRNYRKFLIKNGKFFGSLLVGNVNDCGIIQSLIRRKVDIGELKDLISMRSLNLGAILTNCFSLNLPEICKLP